MNQQNYAKFKIICGIACGIGDAMLGATFDFEQSNKQYDLHLLTPYRKARHARRAE